MDSRIFAHRQQQKCTCYRKQLLMGIEWTALLIHNQTKVSRRLPEQRSNTMVATKAADALSLHYYTQ